MKKQELVNAIAQEFPSLSRKEIINFLKTFTTVLERGFQANGMVRIDGFGTIKKLPDGSPAFRFFPSFARDSEINGPEIDLEDDDEATEEETPELPEPPPENKTVLPMRKRTSAVKKK